MAYHWARAGFPFHFISRIGDDHPEVFLEFLRRHGIDHSPSIVCAGASATTWLRPLPDRAYGGRA